MAENFGSKHEDIGEVKLCVKLENIHIFEKLQTKEFFVRGNPWYISFEKRMKSNRDHLAISLRSNAKHESNDSFVIGTFKLKTMSSKLGFRPFETMFSAQVFTTNRTSATLDIPWNEIINPGCVENDECKIKIKVKASPLQNSICSTDWVTFKTVGICLRKTYRITVKKFDEFIGVSPPEFVFNNILFRVSVIPYEDQMFIKLNNIKGAKCILSLAFRLISFNPSVMPLAVEFKRYQLHGIGNTHFFRLARWEQLTDAANYFIRDNSFVIDIDMSVEEIEDEEQNAKDRRAYDEYKKWMCPICFEDLETLPLSTLLCGHIHCTPCLRQSVENYKRCPKCMAPAALDDLRKTYLPS